MEIKTLELKRVYLQTETLGSIYDGKELVTKTMELPWKNNQSNISCIPEGEYLVMKQAPSFGRAYGYFRFKEVPGRGMNYIAKASTILIHRITYVKDLQGCIGVGEFKDLNGDNVPDMINSGKTLQKMYETLPDQFLLNISEK